MTDKQSSHPVGLVLGTEDATPLEWWVTVSEDAYLQLGDVVQVRTTVPEVGEVRISGVVDLVRALQEGLQFEGDTARASQGIMPAETAQAAHVITTRVEPEFWVPPSPGDEVLRVRGEERDEALYFDDMYDQARDLDNRLVAGISRDGQPVYVDFSFLNGQKGAHVNISGISGVATKTSYASFLLYSMFQSGVLGREAANTKAIVFNVKGEDLLFLDKPNSELDEQDRQQYQQLGLEPEPFQSVGIWAPTRKQTQQIIPATGTRQEGVQAYFWTVKDVVEQKLLRYMFVESGDERSQIADLVSRVESALTKHARAAPKHQGAIRLPDEEDNLKLITSFQELCEAIEQHLVVEDPEWTGRMAHGTITAFLRRLNSAKMYFGHLIRGAQTNDPEKHQIDWRENQISVIDIHQLHDRAKRFVVGTTIKRLFDQKEESEQNRPLVFLVLDELNKYAPREGWSPIKEVLLDIAERGRSLGVILMGAQQTASEVERRVVSNSAIRVVGRLDPAEASRKEYGWLPEQARKRSKLLKPGHMMIQQPSLPMPLEVQFPFPAWATRKGEVARQKENADDPFDAFKEDE